MNLREGISGIYVLTFSGECIFANKQRQVDNFLAEALEILPKRLIVDLTSCSLLDSSGIGFLIAYHNKLKEKQPEARIAVVIGQSNYLIRKLINLGVFNRSGIEIFKSISEAEFSLSKG